MFHADGKIELLIQCCKTSEDFTPSLSTHSNTKKLIIHFFLCEYPHQACCLNICTKTFIMLVEMIEVGICLLLGEHYENSILFPYSFAITVRRILNYFF